MDVSVILILGYIAVVNETRNLVETLKVFKSTDFDNDILSHVDKKLYITQNTLIDTCDVCNHDCWNDIEILKERI